ncbi:mitochondrial basic amino acids transporter-like [Patiria miniata]|uniref:Mitochondrial basic amino acids transporter n=1 Tax=Patiria miniata TaxID=46514 RepID=A0A914BIQ9_PATMI|nr:mitochondrial basic amino acids transporter-like [Patiria miniata]XP_038075315.1 mitochondrial basic amino acids transporter-like [Patiria miniata]XP_038075316.1 mitochondrial basic amino acids transporter-like [Patiria miniata]XP_038075317.1 mitochondrial basic amino acids transporter-like [Patiria miniata]
MAQLQQTPVELEEAHTMDASAPSKGGAQAGSTHAAGGSVAASEEAPRALDANKQNGQNGVSSRWIMASDFIAGCVGGAAGVLVGQPFDTVKVRLQAQTLANTRYRGVMHCFYTIARQESVFGLYKGMASPLAGLAFINTIVFGIQGNMMRQIENQTPFSHFCCGAVAGSVQSVIAGPMELAKIRMQMEGIGEDRQHQTKTHYKGSLDALRTIYHDEGIRGCYRGFTLTLLRDAPGFAIYFMSYDVLCRNIGNLSKDNEIGIGGLLMAGGLSGMISWCVSFAADVMKTRIQADGVEGAKSCQYTGTIDMIKKSYHSEGIMVFTKGLGASLLRAFPVNAATFTVVTLMLSFIQGDDQTV